VFNVIDGGDLDQDGTPLGKNENAVTIAPEVVHLSRFASLYKFYPDDRLPTRVDLCLHNGNVAEQLRCGPLARMWRALASMLSGSALDELPQKGGSYQPLNAMQFVLLPTIKSLLEERADAGDVQTCVAVCEVLQVIQPNQQTRIPGLEINRVREWYLSYIDLLHQMCLFSAATFLIRSCKDPYIGALNQQSTTYVDFTKLSVEGEAECSHMRALILLVVSPPFLNSIHESCPRCGKPLPPASAVNAGETSSTSARRACKNCRRRVGLCFLCHEPVKGMYVWCPGCGTWCCPLYFFYATFVMLTHTRLFVHSQAMADIWITRYNGSVD
jgi:WD repeat-containing protein 24